jgi:phage repressor protein C with HTH and peptisase S24 domain
VDVDRFEQRRLALKKLVDDLGRGGRATVAKQIKKEPSYIARLLYPPGKPGRKRIGDELLEAITRAYPNWLSEAPPPARSTAAPLAPSVFPPRRNPAEYLPAADGKVGISGIELQRALGFQPEPGRIRLFEQTGHAMRPKLDDGDVAVIDTAVSQFNGDGYYLVSMGGDMQVKLLQRRGADLWVVSHNPEFPEWRAADEHDVFVCGRAVLVACLRPM